ncbi:RluA family pseudouridine synthase [Candidatus Dojkabacteria bacterium]|nr:RluA family pseudouridine synthase [Candidatus Dojkabacteria bacterium]
MADSEKKINELFMKDGYEVTSSARGYRVDRLLCQVFDDWSRKDVSLLIKNSGVKVNGESVRKGSKRLKNRDIVLIDQKVFEKVKKTVEKARDAKEFTYYGDEKTIEPENLPLEIVYEENEFIVVNKPAGMVVHPAYKNPSGTLVNAVAGYFKRNKIQLPRRVGLVHRIDKDVSGLLIIAKDDHSLSALSSQFSGVGITGPGIDVSMKARKLYWAVIKPESSSQLESIGLLKKGAKMDTITVEGYIRRSRADRRVSEFNIGRPFLDASIKGSRSRANDANGAANKGRYCLSFMKLVSKLPKGEWLIEVEIITGRTHQIRSQLSSLGIPVVGDKMYGGKENRHNDISMHGIALRSVALDIIPPGVYKECIKERKLAMLLAGKDKKSVDDGAINGKAEKKIHEKPYCNGRIVSQRATRGLECDKFIKKYKSIDREGIEIDRICIANFVIP